MTKLIINLSRVTQQVGIIDSKGRKTSFRLMARGRVQTNYEIDPNWLARNQGKIKVATLKTPVETASSQPAPTSTSNAAVSKTATAATPIIATSIASEYTPAEGAK
jgi:hypothetical protein